MSRSDAHNPDQLHILEPGQYDGHSGKIVITCGREILFPADGSEPLWDYSSLKGVSGVADRLQFLGLYGGRQAFALELVPPEASALPGTTAGLRDQLGRIPAPLFRLLGRALQINEWRAAHGYCGYCGGRTEQVPGERAMGCPDCHKIFYPRISPCIMALVTRGEECLLARNSAWKVRRFSVVAGFIEPGESAEDAVHREVMEEVGVRVEGLEYIDSQPWPFPGQLMLGFFARHSGGEIRVDGEEIAEAHWYHYSALPPIPDQHALSGQLIRRFVERCRSRV